MFPLAANTNHLNVNIRSTFVASAGQALQANFSKGTNFVYADVFTWE